MGLYQRCGTVWLGEVGHGMARSDMARPGDVWLGAARSGGARSGMVRLGKEQFN